jgi:hypothetical protein
MRLIYLDITYFYQPARTSGGYLIPKGIIPYVMLVEIECNPLFIKIP